MNEVSSPPKLVRTEVLNFFSEEEVARARSYHRPLYWAAAADLAIEASVLGALVWSGAGAALDPGSLPWWGRTPAYAAIVVVLRRPCGRRLLSGVVSSASGAGRRVRKLGQAGFAGKIVLCWLKASIKSVRVAGMDPRC